MKQKGQGIIEFALIVPFLIGMGVAIVYMGIMFLDYTQYSNAVRDAARDIALQTRSAEGNSSKSAAKSSIAAQRTNLVTLINSQDSNVLKRYSTPFTNIYNAKWEATFYKKSDSSTNWEKTLNEKYLKATTSAVDALFVEVSVTLSFEEGVKTGGILSEWGIIPSTLSPITYRMVLEQPTLINYSASSD